MEIRLNKLISEAGVCSRREADNFIEMERVTVNGKQPHVGQKVTAEDVVYAYPFHLDEIVRYPA